MTCGPGGGGRCWPSSCLVSGGSLPWACVKGEGVGWGEGMTSLPLFLEMNPWKILKWCSRLWSHWDTAGLRLETGCGNMQSRQDQTDFLTHFCGKASPSEKPAPRAEGELSCGSRADTGPLHRNGGLCLGRGRGPTQTLGEPGHEEKAQSQLLSTHRPPASASPKTGAATCLLGSNLF